MLKKKRSGLIFIFLQIPEILANTILHRFHLFDGSFFPKIFYPVEVLDSIKVSLFPCACCSG